MREGKTIEPPGCCDADRDVSRSVPCGHGNAGGRTAIGGHIYSRTGVAIVATSMWNALNTLSTVYPYQSGVESGIDDRYPSTKL